MISKCTKRKFYSPTESYNVKKLPETCGITNFLLRHINIAFKISSESVKIAQFRKAINSV